MSYPLKTSLGIALALALSGHVAGQGVVVQHNLSLGLATTMAQATLAACRAQGFHTAAAVVDRAGQTLVLLRDEQATAQHLEMARRMAYTARMFQITSMEFRDRTAKDPTLAGQRSIADILPLGGGVPVRIGDETIGAIGSAGSPTQEADDGCAKAGLARAAELLK